MWQWEIPMNGKMIELNGGMSISMLDYQRLTQEMLDDPNDCCIHIPIISGNRLSITVWVPTKLHGASPEKPSSFDWNWLSNTPNTKKNLDYYVVG
jgi:hypothetical protein